MVEKPLTFEAEDFHKSIQTRQIRMSIDMQQYGKHWSMVVPWLGFQYCLSFKRCKPLISSAKYI